ncbi:MAG: ANTAR domain-containing protein [Oscillospiraceae bacterium]|nr:ANTAR domain-containing protein [Oscillospiraceae bacterium]
MRPGARKLSILVSKSSGVTAAEMLKLLPALRLSADICAADTGEIAALLAEKPADAAVLGADGFELACDICERPGTAVLIVAPDSAMEDLRPACALNGILTARPGELEVVFPLLAAVCMRMRALRAQTSTLQRKLDDSRYISRAKLLLMTRLNMSEAAAHRYIEKTAMDTGAKRREVAESIIRTYEE